MPPPHFLVVCESGPCPWHKSTHHGVDVIRKLTIFCCWKKGNDLCLWCGVRSQKVAERSTRLTVFLLLPYSSNPESPSSLAVISIEPIVMMMGCAIINPPSKQPNAIDTFSWNYYVANPIAHFEPATHTHADRHTTKRAPEPVGFGAGKCFSAGCVCALGIGRESLWMWRWWKNVRRTEKGNFYFPVLLSGRLSTVERHTTALSTRAPRGVSHEWVVLCV